MNSMSRALVFQAGVEVEEDYEHQPPLSQEVPKAQDTQQLLPHIFQKSSMGMANWANDISASLFDEPTHFYS